MSSSDTQSIHGTQANAQPDNLTLKNQTLELLAERPQVNIERVATGHLSVRKEVRSRTINVPVTLQQEILIIEQRGALPPANDNPVTTTTVKPDSQAHISINGEKVSLDTPIELIISQETAAINIVTQVVEEIAIRTEQHRTEQQIPMTLRYEELVTEEKIYDNPKVIAQQVIEQP